MKTVLAGLFAASMLAVSPITIITTAQAAVVPGSDVCGELPNAKWSWQISTSEPVITGGETSTEITGDVSYNTRGNVGTADVTTTTEPTISTVTISCVALNPQGKINDDHSTTTTQTTVLDPGGTSTESQVVCNPSGTLIGGTCPVN